MSDARYRELERAAAAGDTSAAVNLLRAKVRTGVITPSRIELAAYCEDPVAIAAVGRQSSCPGYDGQFHMTCCRGSDGWVRGLTRWADIGPSERWVAYFAMVAAARPALDAWRRSLKSWRCQDCPRSGCKCGAIADEFERRAAPGRTIMSAAHYLVNPTEENLREWFDFWAQSLFYIDGENAWTPKPRVSERECYERIMAAVRIAGPTALDAVKAELTDWALGN